MSEMVLKIIGVQVYNGLSKLGEPYSLYTLEVDHMGEKCKIKTFLENGRPGDYAEVVIGTRNSVYGKELAAIVKSIIPADQLKDNWTT